MAQDEVAALGQTGGGNLDDLAAVNLTQHTLDLHVLGHVAVAHKGGILLQQTGELVADQSDSSRIRDVRVAQSLLSLQEQLIGIGLGGGGAVIGSGIGCDLAEGVGVHLGNGLQAHLAGYRLACIFSNMLP